MEEKFLTVDIASISNTKKIMDDKLAELLPTIDRYKNIIENTQNIYDTESATLYRKVALGYIELVQKYLNNNLKPYIDKLDKIKNAYVDEYNAIADSITGGNEWKEYI